ncbi:unnamed protein product [Ascophyllum nodosum]
MTHFMSLWRYGLVVLLNHGWLRHTNCFVLPVRRRMRFLSSTGSLNPGRTRIRAVAGETSDADAPIPNSLDRSAPPNFIAKNNVSLDGEFIVTKEGEPTEAELNNHNVIKIIAQKCTDKEVNWLVWKCLGYRFDTERELWMADNVFPLWKEKYPEPPDLIGVTRVYSREVDRPVMKANQALVRSIPMEFKRSIMEHLKPIGFTGYKMDELTPNRTRRAQVTNFIIYFREELWGVSLEELRLRRKERKESEARKPLVPAEETSDVEGKRTMASSG